MHRLPGLDLLRSIAIVWVMFFHSFLVDGPKFRFAHVHSDAFADQQRWVLPLEGTVHCDGEKVGAGECLLVEAGKSIVTTDARLFVGAEY